MISDEKAIDAMIGLLEHETCEGTKRSILNAVIQIICQENESADLAWLCIIRELGGRYERQYRHQSKDDGE